VRSAAKPPAGGSPAPRRAIRVHPVTPERWPDVEALFGPRGACAGCWCMWWRVRRSEWSKGKGDGNRRALRSLVRRGEPTGLLAYAGEEPVGWAALAPREAYPGLERSRTLQRVDDRPVWSVTCFFVARAHRRRGVTVKLLEAAVRHARARGAECIEGYPIEPKKGSVPDVWVFTGLAAAFRKAGFREVARRSETRPIMRRTLRATRARVRGA
jgi:GNAT superfamily N-acetyltransferase